MLHIQKTQILENLILYRNRQTGGFWAKDGKTGWACAAARALVILPEAVALRDNRGQKDRALGFTGFAGQWPCAAREASRVT
jgi:hypothetical protein